VKGAAALIVTAAVVAGCGGDRPARAPGRPACVAPPGVAAGPATVDDVVALANGLLAERGAPVSLPCFLESLQRPLGALTTRSIFSLQPATGIGSPRIFLFSHQLVLTVVPVGAGSDLLEMGLLISPTRSIKSEIQFPVESPLPPEAPYARIRVGTTSTCAGCHPHETAVTTGGGIEVLESAILRPLATEEVALGVAQAEHLSCDPALEPQRCEMLAAVFAHGDLLPASLPASAQTIYDN
jgi:hypothetical protein